MIDVIKIITRQKFNGVDSDNGHCLIYLVAKWRRSTIAAWHHLYYLVIYTPDDAMSIVNHISIACGIMIDTSTSRTPIVAYRASPFAQRHTMGADRHSAQAYQRRRQTAYMKYLGPPKVLFIAWPRVRCRSSDQHAGNRYDCRPNNASADCRYVVEI